VTPSLLEDLGQDLAMMARLVQSQLITATTAFFQRDTGLAQQVMDRDDQVDNRLGFIEEKRVLGGRERVAGRSARSREIDGSAASRRGGLWLLVQ
jgi:hypothetical protein